jgi:hypothetical protein
MVCVSGDYTLYGICFVGRPQSLGSRCNPILCPDLTNNGMLLHFSAFIVDHSELSTRPLLSSHSSFQLPR